MTASLEHIIKAAKARYPDAENPVEEVFVKHDAYRDVARAAQLALEDFHFYADRSGGSWPAPDGIGQEGIMGRELTGKIRVLADALAKGKVL